jgi:calcineurin-like phosphoesterase family protein
MQATTRNVISQNCDFTPSVKEVLRSHHYTWGPMPQTWFTSDTHFGHANIIRLCRRPFLSVSEMDNVMVSNWNAAIDPEDEVWHLGDFAHRSARSPADYLRRLNGRKNLIWGNHDSNQSKMAPGWITSQAYAEVMVDGTRLTLFHYAMKVWNSVGRGAVHLYGHSHGRLAGDAQSCDMGVDAWAFRPQSLATIKLRLARLPPYQAVDHHGP